MTRPASIITMPPARAAAAALAVATDVRISALANESSSLIKAGTSWVNWRMRLSTEVSLSPLVRGGRSELIDIRVLLVTQAYQAKAMAMQWWMAMLWYRE